MIKIDEKDKFLISNEGVFIAGISFKNMTGVEAEPTSDGTVLTFKLFFKR